MSGGTLILYSIYETGFTLLRDIAKQSAYCAIKLRICSHWISVHWLLIVTDLWMVSIQLELKGSTGLLDWHSVSIKLCMSCLSGTESGLEIPQATRGQSLVRGFIAAMRHCCVFPLDCSSGSFNCLCRCRVRGLHDSRDGLHLSMDRERGSCEGLGAELRLSMDRGGGLGVCGLLDLYGTCSRCEKGWHKSVQGENNCGLSEDLGGNHGLSEDLSSGGITHRPAMPKASGVYGGGNAV